MDTYIRSVIAVFACSGFLVTQATSEDFREQPAIKVAPVHDSIGPDMESIRQAIQQGRSLFRTKFNLSDGAGRPLATGDGKPTPRFARVDNPFQRIAGPDASACSSCHNEPRVGGSGDSVTNTFVGAHFSDPPTPSTLPRDTNERNSVTTFGSGVIETLAAEMTDELQAIRSRAVTEAKRTGSKIAVHLQTKGVSFGSIDAHPDGYIDYRAVQGIDYDLVIKPFGIKGIVISLREFSINALNQHHGIQPIERFGWERTGTTDFDQDGVANEFSIGQVTAMSLFQASLPPPQQAWSTKSDEILLEKRGEQLFRETGCAGCHRPELVLNSAIFNEPNKYNRPGALTPQYTTNTIKYDLGAHLDRDQSGRFVVRAFTDLKRHNMCDEDIKFFCNEERRQDNVRVNFFVTQKLWDLATSAPYCHRGDCTTLTEAIMAHGGEGRASRDAFVSLPTGEKQALIAFLNTLGRRDISEESP